MPSLIARFVIAFAATLTAMGASPAAAEWREASSDHFLIYANSGESWLRSFAERLERFDSAMRTLRQLPSQPEQRSNRLVIYAVQGTDAVQRLCGKCGSVAGFYIPRVGGSVVYTSRTTASSSWDISSDIVLFHEYSHHFMLENFASAYPSWFVEGFAEFNSTATFDRDGGMSLGRPANHRAYGLTQLARIPVEQLFDRPTKMTDEQKEVFYARSWLLTHYLTFNRERMGQLDRYVRAINAGKSSLDAAHDAFGDFRQLDKELDAAISRPFRYLPIEGKRLTTGAIVQRVLTRGEAATMAVRMRSDRGVDDKAAKALLPEARRQALAYPSDPGAQEVLAEAEYDAGNDAEAEAAADRALAMEPKRLQAMLYKGRAMMRRTRPDDVKAQREARGWFVKANREFSDAAEPLMLNYMSFLHQGIKPSVNASDGLIRAFQLSPQDRGLRFMAARQLLIDNKLDDARRVLLPLAYDPHIRSDENLALSLVQLIDKGALAKDVVASVPNGEGKSEAPDGIDPQK